MSNKKNIYICATFVIYGFSLKITALYSHIVKLNIDPKNSAKTVHVSVMTLYGIEKSGVGKLTSTISEYML